MSWSELPQLQRWTLIGVLTTFVVTGCGLRPLHGGATGEVVNRHLAQVDIDAPRNRLGQILRNELIEELNPAGLSASSEYRLLVRLERSKDALAVQLDDVVTRYDLTLLAKYELRRKADETILYQSAARRVASYNVVRAPFATLVAEQDAERRAATELAREIRVRLAIYFAGNAA